MKTRSSSRVFCRITLLACIFAGAGTVSYAQQVLMPPRLPAQGTVAAQSAPARTAAGDSTGATGAAGPNQRAEIYYDVTMAHLYEVDYETSSKSEDANRAIDFYKKAYALDPNSPVIGEQLAEMYFVAQRIRDAVTEAQQILRRDPSNLPTRRLLARIYIRSLGDLSKSADEPATVALAVEQLSQIVRLDPTDVESALWLARLERLSGKHEEAEKVLRGILAGDPDNESALQQLTQLLLDAGKSNEAVDLLEQALARTPSADLYEQLGDAYTQLHDASDAEKAYRSAVDLEPDQASHRRSLAQSLFDQGKYPEASAEYQKLADAEPDDANNHLRLAEIDRSLRKFDKAEQEVLLAKKRAPGNLEVLYNEASIYEAEERYDDAIRVLSDAVAGVKGQAEVTPGRRRTLAILYQLLGQFYKDGQNYTAAINTFREMVKLGPEEDRRGRLLIMDSYRADRDLPHAFEEARKGLADYPHDRGLSIGEAMLYGDNNQSAEAEQLLRPLLNNSPADLEIYFDLAQIYEQDRHFAEAEQTVHTSEKLTQRASDRETATFLLGGIFAREKKYDEAEQMFKSILALDPSNAPVLNFYGYILADRGMRLDEAVDLLRRALDQDPTNPAYLDSIGWAYYKQNKLTEAEAAVRKAVTRDAHDPSILAHLGDILAKGGSNEQAAAAWERSLAEWHRMAPADFEADKAAELEQKITSVKRRVAQQNPRSKPQ
jgi:tetratricopeptide (TPR) repeat protein